VHGVRTEVDSILPPRRFLSTPVPPQRFYGQRSGTLEMPTHLFEPARSCLGWPAALENVTLFEGIVLEPHVVQNNRRFFDLLPRHPDPLKNSLRRFSPASPHSNIKQRTRPCFSWISLAGCSTLAAWPRQRMSAASPLMQAALRIAFGATICKYVFIWYTGISG
jgi:hypothetical protein